jgi:hypothetical protein
LLGEVRIVAAYDRQCGEQEEDEENPTFHRRDVSSEGIADLVIIVVVDSPAG